MLYCLYIICKFHVIQEFFYLIFFRTTKNENTRMKEWMNEREKNEINNNNKSNIHTHTYNRNRESQSTKSILFYNSRMFFSSIVPFPKYSIFIWIGKWFVIVWSLSRLIYLTNRVLLLLLLWKPWKICTVICER